MSWQHALIAVTCIFLAGCATSQRNAPPDAVTCSGPLKVDRQVMQPAQSPRGLDFPGSDATAGTIRFRFRNPLAPYPATYIWRIKPRSQASYYTTFFWGNDDGAENLDTFLWDHGKSNSYYGAHPYPSPAPNMVPPDKVGPRHWEISVASMDILSDSTVEYDRWHLQALLVWADAKGRKHHEFYWDLPDTRKVIRHRESADYGATLPPAPALTFGDAPWNPSKEILDGVLRGIQIYSARLTMSDVLAEIDHPLSTAAGAACVWYVNRDPTPDDISDKSGSGNDPEWVGMERPVTWKQDGTATPATP